MVPGGETALGITVLIAQIDRHIRDQPARFGVAEIAGVRSQQVKHSPPRHRVLARRDHTVNRFFKHRPIQPRLWAPGQVLGWNPFRDIRPKRSLLIRLGMAVTVRRHAGD
jgi:hypothetical protein